MKYYLNSPEKPKWYKYLILAVGVPLILYLVFMGAYFATSEPSFCNGCHFIKPYVASWRSSPHKGVKCLYCHEMRGFVGKLESKARGLNYVYQYITGQYTAPFKAKIFEQNCAACHLGDYYNYKTAPRIDMKHYQFMQKKKSCQECHIETGHKTGLFTSDKFKK